METDSAPASSLSGANRLRNIWPISQSVFFQLIWLNAALSYRRDVSTKGDIARGGMKMRSLTAVLLGSALAIGSTVAFAQDRNGPQCSPHYNDYLGRSAPAEPCNGLYAGSGNAGNGRETAYGQGGTAGTYPTGAHVGPGRAEMNHAD